MPWAVYDVFRALVYAIALERGHDAEAALRTFAEWQVELYGEPHDDTDDA